MTKKIIFAVDDETIMRFVYQEILADEYELHCFESPQQILDLADKVKPDLVILDIGLVGMNGYELCDMFKKKQKMEDVPVVFVTGQDFSQDKGQAFFSGASEYVTKPIDADVFLELVQELLLESSSELIVH